MKAAAQFYGLDRTGGMIVWYQYLEALCDRGVELQIDTLGTVDDGRFLPPIDGVETRYHGHRAKPYKAVVRAVPGNLGFPNREVKVLTAARPANVDVRLCANTFTVASSIDGSTPVLHHVQHDERLFEPEGRRRRFAEQLLCHPDVVRTANCTWVADRLDDMGSSSVRIIAPAIDHEVFVPGPIAVDGPSRPFRVLTLGKSVDWKGLPDVVEAVRLLTEAGRDVTLVSYGPNQPKVPRSVRLEHHGLVDGPTLVGLLHGADVAVSASWYESFPLPPLEAMATGTPIVCTRLGTEDYAEHEVNALVVAPKVPQGFADAIARVMDDAELRQAMIAAGLATAPRFRWEVAVDAFCDEVAKVAGVGALS